MEDAVKQGIAGAVAPVASRRSLLSALLMALVLSCAACGRSNAVLQAFRTEQQAQDHCPGDTVVWVDVQAGGYWSKGQGPYGGGNAGRYACRGEAEKSGMHAMTP
jgi:hypothetical protein